MLPPAERMRALLEGRRPAYSLQRELYVDTELYELELEHIWGREWVFAGHGIEIPGPGDYLTLPIGHYNIIVLRGADGVVRALHNVCRHRGSMLCDQAQGSVQRRIVCPYHQWSYELDGRLARARKTDAGFEPNDHGLVQASCEMVGGMIFVSVAESPPDFAPVASLVGRYLAPFDLEHAKVAFSSTIVEDSNWKLVLENNRECYHCKGAHPELCATFPEAPLHSGGGEGDDLAALQQIVERCEAMGLPSAFTASADHQYRAMRLPLLGTARSMTHDGEPAVARRFGHLPADNIGDVLLYHYPSTWNHFVADHAVTFRMLPIGPMQTQLTTTWLVPGSAEAGVDYDVESLTSVWLATNAQDKVLVERAQRGVRSPAYRPGPYSTAEEEGVIQLIDWYATSMQGALGDGLQGAPA
ncbi:unannotated protein [freshwater metagenome]|uniref:Unannotated protein n=1 Tax=freshwater metagenome TaxID=449393 RepID=A0A6J7EB53_9ZZZZ|nr:Rieske 2Fe-2S domain-containing protein [Actinomycetota bacterium]